MSNLTIYEDVFAWCRSHMSSKFSEGDMSTDISLLGLDSIDIVEFCEYIEAEYGIEADYDWIMDFESLADICDSINKTRVIAVPAV